MEERTKAADRHVIKPLSTEEIDRMLQKVESAEFNSSIIQTVRPAEAMTDQIESINKKVDEAAQQINDIFRFIKVNDTVPIQEIKRDIIPIIKEAVEIPHLYYLFEELNRKDEYTYRHNICVAVIGGLIGKWMGLPEEQIREVELAGILHDIGKTYVPEYILNKPGKLTEAEYKEIKRHTLYGYQLLRKTPNIPDSVALAALQHHERENGLGYPFQLNGEQMNLVSKIIAVADVFHAMSSSRVYREADPFHKVIRRMNDDLYGAFNPSVMFVFLSNIMETMLGKKVQLSNGHIGTILYNHPFYPLKSLIQLEDLSIIDMRDDKELQIEKVFS